MLEPLADDMDASLIMDSSIEEADDSLLDTPTKEAPVPQSFFSPELPKRVQNLFGGFGTPQSAPTSPSMVRRLSSDIGDTLTLSQKNSASMDDLSQGMPVFKSELSSRVNNLFGGFDMTPVKSTPDKSSRLQQLESNIRDTPVDVSSPQQPAGGVAGVQGGKQKRSQSIKTMPIFASELTKRVQALFTGFDATPMKLAPTRRLRTDIQTIDDKEV